MYSRLWKAEEALVWFFHIAIIAEKTNFFLSFSAYLPTIRVQTLAMHLQLARKMCHARQE